MADDQVKYSELVKNDNNNFQSLIDALEKVKEKLAELKAEASNLSSSLRSVGTATKQQQQSTAEDAAAAERLSRDVKTLTDEEARLKAAIAEANRMQKLQAQANSAAAGSLNEMRAKYKLLVAEMGNYNLKSAEGQRKMKATAAEARRLRDEIYKLESAYGQFGRNVGNYSGSIQRFSARLKEAAARFVAFNTAFLSFTGLIRFGKALYETRKELESTLVTYKALAGEIQGAKLFEEVKNFALSTPVTLNAASKAVQTMLSFGVSQEKVVDIMKRLGDISSADSERMQRLALAYSQATQAGRLMGQDTLQFINAGFNPLYYISLRTGESMEYLRDQMKKGKIDIQQVTQAIIDATSEGGQFNGMLEKQRETMKGAAAIMEGAWQNMLNEMGQDMESGIVGVIKWLTKLMQNWRKTINTLKQIAISLGTAKAAMLLYRVAIDAVTKAKAAETAATTAEIVATNAETAATAKDITIKKLWTSATLLAKNAVTALGASLMKFLPFAVIAGVTMLTQKLIEAANASKRAAKEIKEFEESAAEGVSGTISQYQQLGREWKRLGTNQSERAEWIKEHKRLFDELGVSINNANEADRAFSEEGTDAYIRAIRRRAIADAYKDKLAQLSVKKQELEDSGEAYAWVMTTPVMSTKYQVDTSADGKIWLRDGEQTQVGETTTRAKSAEYIKLENDIAFIEQKIREFENGAMAGLPNKGYTPVTTGGVDDDGKAIKDKVKDLLTLTRALEDARTANIEDEYARLEQAEIQRHERFIQDREAELKLLPENDPRRAVIQQQIEEEKETHDRKMLEIDERYRQAMIKRDEDEKKRKEHAAKDAITSAEREFKARQEIDKRLFELTKHTAKEERKFVMQQQMEFLQWRIDHAAALGISPELLEVMKKEYAQMQAMFNKGIYTTGKKNTYSSGMEVIADVLGFDIDQKQISALNSVFDQAKEALNSWMDARKAAADQAKELADDEVSAAENALNREIELRNQGYANDVALREKELADAKEKQRQAVELQKQYEKEQVLLDAAMQASSMITASANIFKQFPIYVAIPMLATLWGAFAYAKVQAYQAAEKSITFGEGGAMLLEGGSHQSGHDINLGIGPDGSNLRAEGDEYFAVINKRNSRKYGSEIPGIVNALNSGMFEDKYIKTSDAIGLLPPVVKADDGTMVDLSRVEDGVSALVRQGEKSWTVEGDYRVLRYKNLTRRVKIG